MSIDKPRLQKLVQDGEKFSYQNFCSSRSEYGYPQALSHEWLIWTGRLEHLCSELGPNNPASRNITIGLKTVVLGNGEDKFKKALSFLIGGLKIAEALLDEVKPIPLDASPVSGERSKRVFIVHGHDHVAKNELERYLQELGLEPIILHRQADEGRTILEKFEKHSDVGYAFVLLTPDDIGYRAP